MNKKVYFDLGIEVDSFQIDAKRTDVLEMAWKIAMGNFEMGQKPKFIIDGKEYQD